MRCKAAQRALSARLDEPDAVLEARVAQHVAGCARCAAFVDTSQRIRHLLRADEPELALMRSAQTAASPPPRRRPRLVVATSLAVAAAVVGALLVTRSADERVPVIDTSVERFPVVPDGTDALLIWTAGGLPEGFAERVAGLPAVRRTTVVDGDHTRVLVGDETVGNAAVGDEIAVDLDVLGITPQTYAPFVPDEARETITALRVDTAILSRTSSALRGLGVGDLLAFGGRRLRVIGVLDDELVGAAELVVRADAFDAVATPRYLLIAYRGSRAVIERAVQDLVPINTALRFRAPRETAILRHGDAVLPQAWVKRDFGEFTSDPSTPLGSIPADRAFEAANIATYDLPLVGTVRCHRDLEAALRRALDSLPRRTAQTLAGTTATCFDRRLNERGGPSRHAWGIAIDLAVPEVVKGGQPIAPDGLVEAFAAAGFVWGGEWLVPDVAHFEWVGPDRGRTAAP